MGSLLAGHGGSLAVPGAGNSSTIPDNQLAALHARLCRLRATS